MQIKYFLFLIFCGGHTVAQVQQTASELLDKSIAFHDPKGKWDTFKGQLDFRVLRPDKPDGKRVVKINNKKATFDFSATYPEGELIYKVKSNEGSMSWNGSENIPADIAKKYRVSADRPLMYRNYYTYLYGMPMKLKDPGTIIHNDIELANFYGESYYKIKVTYDSVVGKDTWYFYFNLTTYALEAYQFFKDESKNDGEYILFEGLKTINHIKIPKDRKWYYNKDEKYLATDVLE